MNAPHIALSCIAAAALVMSATFVHAQATRTWVSGVGDDANPCSRTAPCKTFPGAISKTAAHGEIDVLDPGGYGTVTITKSITIDGTTGAGFGSILNSGVNGVIINAGTTDVVTLRNLSINGSGSGTAGIRILQAGSVYVENCQIFGNVGADPNGRGISDVRSNAGGLSVLDTIVRNNVNGIVVDSPSVDVTLRNARVLGNGGSGFILSGGWATITNSVIADNASYGVFTDSSLSLLFVGDSIISDNQTGLGLGPSSPVGRLNNVVITNNDVGVTKASGTLFTFGNNKINGNTSGNTPSMTPQGLQ
jgi:hypothetical protein